MSSQSVSHWFVLDISTATIGLVEHLFTLYISYPGSKYLPSPNPSRLYTCFSLLVDHRQITICLCPQHTNLQWSRQMFPLLLPYPYIGANIGFCHSIATWLSIDYLLLLTCVPPPSPAYTHLCLYWRFQCQHCTIESTLVWFGCVVPLFISIDATSHHLKHCILSYSNNFSTFLLYSLYPTTQLEAVNTRTNKRKCRSNYWRHFRWYCLLHHITNSTIQVCPAFVVKCANSILQTT